MSKDFNIVMTHTIVLIDVTTSQIAMKAATVAMHSSVHKKVVNVIGRK